LVVEREIVKVIVEDGAEEEVLEEHCCHGLILVERD
jgi:hypothetical protein